MILFLTALLAVTAFAVLARVLWLSARPARYSTLIAVAAAVLVLGLAVLAATGRLHWLVAVGAALLPFLRQGLRLIRYLPWLASLRGAAGRKTGADTGGPRHRSADGAMSRRQALDVLGLNGRPTEEEIVAAHRRLIQKLHPDRGGSTYLAEQINEARQRLLDEL